MISNMSKRLLRAGGLIALVAVFAVGSGSPARAQWFGGGYGYMGGYSPYAFGYGYPAYGFGYGYPAYGFGYGAPYGYSAGSGYGFTGYGMAGPSFIYNTAGIGPYGYGAFGYGFGPSPFSNPLFGLGLSPLGVQSAVGERYYLGRRGNAGPATTYSRGYAPVRPPVTQPTAPAAGARSR